MKCKDIISILEKKWPPAYALSWDNVGLLVGSQEREVKRILVTLDVTEETLAQAAAIGAELLISHHPLLFSAVKQINDSNFTGRRIISLIQQDISYYAMHTNFDVLGMAQLNGRMMELQDEVPLLVTAAEDDPEGIGRVGMLGQELPLKEFAEFVKKRLKVPQVQIYGDHQHRVSRVAVSGGSGKNMIQPALAAKADVLVSGDIDYHTGIDAVAAGLAVIDAGHYGTEYHFIEYVSQELRSMIPEVEVAGAEIKMPYWVV